MTNNTGTTTEQSAGPGPAASPDLSERLDAVLGQVTLLRHQVVQQLAGLGGLIGQQSAAVKAELDTFRTGGPRHAMAAVFHKLFRDLVGHMNALDELGAGQATAGDTGLEWQKSFQIIGQRFEALLADWGCVPIPVAVGQDHFDPDMHESLPADEEVSRGVEPGIVVAVKRRGWRLHGTIIQYPLVMVS